MNLLPKVTENNLSERDMNVSKKGKGYLMAVMALSKEQICFLYLNKNPKENRESIISFMNEKGFAYFIVFDHENHNENLPVPVVCFKNRALAEEFVVFYPEQEEKEFQKASEVLNKF